MYSTPSDDTLATTDSQATNLIATNKTTRDFLARYISYARKFIQPIIPDEMVDVLVQEYHRMRSQGNSAKTITATPRQLESLIRISEALAKMRLSNKVEQVDIEEATRLIKTAMQQSATDGRTGEIDMDLIYTGVSQASNQRIKVISEYIKKVQVSKEILKTQKIDANSTFYLLGGIPGQSHGSWCFIRKLIRIPQL